ncbi:hypothetical protein PV325_010641 [Microctonus aethiopoides]|nr:hypothetical protein PV325_010641 [Microctonus aethiopoides]
MDPSVNPCDNFYKFTCGQFLNSTFTRPDKKTADWKSDMYEEIVTRLGGLLNSKISENEIELFRQTKQLYRQCLDRKTITEQQDNNVLDILNKFGGWPVVMGDNWNSTDIDWVKTPGIFGYVRDKVLGGYFLSLGLETYTNNPSRTFLEILPMFRSYQNKFPVKNFTDYSDDSLYYNFLIKYAVKLGAEKDRAKIEIMEAMKFESDLLNISLLAFYVDETNESNLQNFMTIDEMMKQWPTIERLTYINSVFSMVSDTKKINKNETVIVNYPTFITNFEKLMSSTPKRIGYPNLYRNDKDITEFFRDLELGESTYFHNLWKIYRFNAAFILRGMRDKDDYFGTWIPIWGSLYTVNAFYKPFENVFTVSPNYLQRSAIDKRQPSYMNYGGIGSVIGHELTHIIDRFQNFVNEDRITKDLLTKTSAENFKKRVDCIIDQYNNYTVEGTNINLNGRLSRKENIAEYVGVKMSYYAYKNWSSQHEPELILPGLNYTPSQMFWISYASIECTLTHPDYLIDELKTDEHAPNQYRVLGSLSNIPEFSKDFNCHPGSPMNPKTKCTIW